MADIVSIFFFFFFFSFKPISKSRLIFLSQSNFYVVPVLSQIEKKPLGAVDPEVITAVLSFFWRLPTSSTEETLKGQNEQPSQVHLSFCICLFLAATEASILHSCT